MHQAGPGHRHLHPGPDHRLPTSRSIFKTEGIQILVIDEADRLFDMGFIKDIRWLFRKLPHYDKRQSMLFSATLSYRVLELTYDYMNMPEFISVTPDDVAVSGIEQSLIHVGREEKLSLLLGILEREDWNRVLIFVNTKAGVEWVAAKLKGNGLPAEGITGDLPQIKRLKLMERFKNNQLKILVATDVASRGIHVEDISHVINYDLPQDAENYVHRIGRTARAGKTGRAISLACEEYVFHLEPLEELLGYSIPVVWPEEDWMGEDSAGDVYIQRRGRSPRPGSRSGPRPGGRSGGRPGDRRPSDSGGDRRPPGRKPMKIKITRPGGIFGLCPRWPADAESPDQVVLNQPRPVTDQPRPMTEQPEAEDDPGRKKKKRRRRKKKSPAETPEAQAVESAAEADQAEEAEAPEALEPDQSGGDQDETAEEKAPPKKKRRRRKPKKKEPAEELETAAEAAPEEIQPETAEAPAAVEAEPEPEPEPATVEVEPEPEPEEVQPETAEAEPEPAAAEENPPEEPAEQASTEAEPEK